MAAYVIANVEIHDVERYAEYSALARPTLAAHGARVLAAGGASEVLEGDVGAHRVVVIEFASVAAARAWHNSPEYREARAIRETCARADFLLVEGI